ncbi:hypothetical protein MNBD_ACTINO02-1587 [hydrothermal vent metagenome]|uniref:Uncharacterized protein n=1 Tax=hydrothermal vent metagenome TaxID=652676 RepID=A0A3B0S0V8_9ZZZZ
MTITCFATSRRGTERVRWDHHYTEKRWSGNPLPRLVAKVRPRAAKVGFEGLLSPRPGPYTLLDFRRDLSAQEEPLGAPPLNPLEIFV